MIKDTFSGVLIGNKVDREKAREVSVESAERFAEQNDLTYFETSVVNILVAVNLYLELGRLMNVLLLTK